MITRTRSLWAATSAALVVTLAIAIGSLGVMSQHPAAAAPHFAKVLRPAAPGFQSTTYPINADNGTDIFEPTGATTILTVPLIAPAAATTKQITGIAGKQIVILGMSYSASGAAGTVQLQDEAQSPNKLTGVYGCLQNTATNLNFNKGGYVTTLAGASVDAVTVGASAVFGGTITYCYY